MLSALGLGLVALSVLLLVSSAGANGSINADAPVQEGSASNSKDPTLSSKPAATTKEPAVDEGRTSGNSLNARGEGAQSHESTGSQESTPSVQAAAGQQQRQEEAGGQKPPEQKIMPNGHEAVPGGASGTVPDATSGDAGKAGAAAAGSPHATLGHGNPSSIKEQTRQQKAGGAKAQMHWRQMAAKLKQETSRQQQKKTMASAERIKAQKENARKLAAEKQAVDETASKPTAEAPSSDSELASSDDDAQVMAFPVYLCTRACTFCRYYSSVKTVCFLR